jgi:hypothetical protein
VSVRWRFLGSIFLDLVALAIGVSMVSVLVFFIFVMAWPWAPAALGALVAGAWAAHRLERFW